MDILNKIGDEFGTVVCVRVLWFVILGKKLAQRRWNLICVGSRSTQRSWGFAWWWWRYRESNFVCASMEVLSCIWSSGSGGLKTSMPYVLLTRPFSFLNSTFLNSSRALSRLGGSLTEVCTAVDGSIIGHAAAAQEDAVSSNRSNLPSIFQWILQLAYSNWWSHNNKWFSCIMNPLVHEIYGMLPWSGATLPFVCRPVVWSNQLGLNPKDMMELLLRLE